MTVQTLSERRRELEQRDPNTYKVQKNAIYYNKTQHANFLGNPFYRATERHLNNNQSVKNDEKWDGELIHLSFFGWDMSSASEVDIGQLKIRGD